MCITNHPLFLHNFSILPIFSSAFRLFRSPHFSSSKAFCTSTIINAFFFYSIMSPPPIFYFLTICPIRIILVHLLLVVLCLQKSTSCYKAKFHSLEIFLTIHL